MNPRLKYLSSNIAKFLGVAFVLSFGALISVALVIWFFPQTIIHEKNFQRFAVPFLKSNSITISHKDLSVSATSTNFWTKRITFDSENVCFSFYKASPTCAKLVSVALLLNLKNFSLHRIEVESLTLLSDNFYYGYKPSPNSATNESSTDVWDWIKTIYLKDIHIDVTQFHISLPDDALIGNLSIKNSLGTNFQLFTNVASKNKTTFQNFSLEASHGSLSRIDDLLRLNNLKLAAQISRKESAKLNIERKEEGPEEARFDIRGAFDSPSIRTRLSASVDQKGRDLQGKLNGEISLSGLVKGPIAIRECSFGLSLSDPARTNSEESLSPVENGNLACKFEVLTQQLLKDQSIRQALPRKISMILTAHIAKQLSRSGAQEMIGKAQLEAGPVISRLITGRVRANYEVNLTRVDEESTLDFEPILVEGDITVLNFKNLAQFFNASNILVPSPLNVLQGKVNFVVNGSIHPKPFSGDLVLELVSNLSSQYQALDLNALGRIKFKACESPEKNTFVHIDLETTNMKIKVPSLDYKDPPALVPDSRFIMAQKQKGADGCRIDYSLKFRNKDRPILILSEFLKRDLPVAIRLHAQSEKDPEGKLEISNYSTTLFRRDTIVEHFKLDFKTKEIDGRIRIDYADYKIFVLLSGHTQSIKINMQSNPPLPNEQVLSVLLFGKTLEGLEPDEAGSVKNVGAAAKDGALTLASLYIFASTPIESVGYNPHTNGLVAKIKLANGSTLNVGANSEGLTDVGFTRRLSKHWRLQTTLKDPSERAQRSASTLLEWFHRF